LDAEGRVLFQAGQMVEDRGVLEGLLARGLFRDPQAEPPQDTAADVEPAARLQLNPGDLLQIQPWSGEAAGERYMVKVVGHLAPVSLLVTAPSANGKLLFVREGHT